MVDADQISVSDLYKMVSTLTASRWVFDVCFFIPEAVNHYNVLCSCKLQIDFIYEMLVHMTLCT